MTRAAAVACGKDRCRGHAPLRSVQLDPARKAFPLRLNHFLTDITRVQRELAWEPRFDLAKGLADSFQNDYAIAPSAQPDFSADAALIGA